MMNNVEWQYEMKPLHMFLNFMWHQDVAKTQQKQPPFTDSIFLLSGVFYRTFFSFLFLSVILYLLTILYHLRFSYNERSIQLVLVCPRVSLCPRKTAKLLIRNWYNLV